MAGREPTNHTGKHALPIIAGAIGLGLIIWAHFLEVGLRRDLVRDVGLAALISSLIYGLIEQRVHLNRERETEASVLDHVFGEMVDQTVWEDLKASIIMSGIVCETWELDLVIEKRHVEPDPMRATPGTQATEQYISRGIQRYRLCNHRRVKVPVTLRHELQSIVAGTCGGNRLPRFMRLAYVVGNGAATVATDLDEQQLLAANVWCGDELLEKTVLLEPGESVDVTLEREEVVDIPGEFPWYVFWLTKNPKLRVRIADGAEVMCYVLLRHHHGLRWEQRAPEEWSFPTVFLPGQGFAIMTRFAPRERGEGGAAGVGEKPLQPPAK